MSQLKHTRTVDGEALTGARQRQPDKVLMWSMLTLAPSPEAESDGKQNSEHKDVGDEIVRHIVAPLRSLARSWGGHRFNFSRSLETSPPQVQLHLLAPDNVVERVWKFAHALADANRAKVGAVTLSQSADILYPPSPGEPLPEVMEAALARFGGPEGLKLAGEVSEVSSDVATWAINRFPSRSMRSTLAALLLFDTGHALMHGPRSGLWPDRRTVGWDYYWDAHFRFCTPSFSSRAEQVRRSMTAQMPSGIMPAHRMMAALASEPSVEVWRNRWAETIDVYLYRADKQRTSRGAQQLAKAASKLLLNRMGIPLHEEAALGLYARAWSKDLEVQLTGGN